MVRARAYVSDPTGAAVASRADLVQRLRAWSYRRQRLGGTARGPADALQAVVGVYSSHPTAPLSLVARCAGLDEEGFWRLERARAAVRVPAMRRSIHLVASTAAAALFAATRQPASAHRRALREAGLAEAEYDRLAARVLERTGEPVTVGMLQKAEGRPMAAVVREMAYEGLLLRVASGLRGDSLRYVATEAWLGAPLDADPTDSLNLLAGDYLRGYGPARIADFAWWAGVAQRRAAAALGGVSTVDVGDGLLLPAEQADAWDAWDAAERVDADAVDAVPKWDAYTMGYAPDGRGRFIDDEHLGIAYGGAAAGVSASGDGMPLLLRGGRAAGTWSHRFDGDRMIVRWQPLGSGGLSTRQAEHAFAAAGELLGAAVVEVEKA
jgi:hypothetical protein